MKDRTAYFREYRAKNRLKIREYNRLYIQKWRKENGYDSVRASDNRYPEKHKARGILRDAVYRGNIKKGLCEICDEVKTHGHHTDYSKPLEVRWFCALHHKLIHKSLSLKTP